MNPIDRIAYLEIRNRFTGGGAFLFDDGSGAFHLCYEDAWFAMAHIAKDKLKRCFVAPDCLRVTKADLCSFPRYLHHKNLFYAFSRTARAKKSWVWLDTMAWIENKGLISNEHEIGNLIMGDILYGPTRGSANPHVYISERLNTTCGQTWRVRKGMRDDVRSAMRYNLSMLCGRGDFRKAKAPPIGEPDHWPSIVGLKEDHHVEINERLLSIPDDDERRRLDRLMQVDNWIMVYNNANNSKPCRCLAALILADWVHECELGLQVHPVLSRGYDYLLADAKQLAEWGGALTMGGLFDSIRERIKTVCPDATPRETQNMLSFLLELQLRSGAEDIDFDQVLINVLLLSRKEELATWIIRMTDQLLKPEDYGIEQSILSRMPSWISEVLNVSAGRFEYISRRETEAFVQDIGSVLGSHYGGLLEMSTRKTPKRLGASNEGNDRAAATFKH